MLGLFFSVISSVVVSVSEFTLPCLSSPRLLSRLLSRSPWFLSERPFCGRFLSGISVRLFPSWRSPLRPSLPPRLFHHHGYFCYRICVVSFRSFHFFQISPVFSLLSGRLFCVLSVCRLLCPLWSLCFSAVDSVLRNGQNVLPDGR